MEISAFLEFMPIIRAALNFFVLFLSHQDRETLILAGRKMSPDFLWPERTLEIQYAVKPGELCQTSAQAPLPFCELRPVAGLLPY